MLPKISVFVLVYQQAHLIRETLESVLLQDYSNLEIVVGDDASTDGTQVVLREYAEKYPGLFKLVLSEENSGVTVNSNKVLAECTGDYIAILGGDDLWLPRKLHKQLELLQKNPDAALCHTKTEEFDSETGATISYIPERGSAKESPCGICEFLTDSPGYVNSSYLVPRWALPDGGFDERVEILSDWLFTLDVLAKGRMVYVDEVLTRYRRHGNNISSRLDVMFADAMRACDIAENKYPEYRKALRVFRFDWILIYANSKGIWGVLVPRLFEKFGVIISRTIKRKWRSFLNR